jgi:hypothetical protein
MLQFLDHAKPKDGFFARMVENMDTDQARQQLLIPKALDLSESHNLISNIDIERR